MSQTHSESEVRDDMKDRQKVLEWIVDDSGNNRDVISFLSNHTFHLQLRVGCDPQAPTATELINLGLFPCF